MAALFTDEKHVGQILQDTSGSCDSTDKLMEPNCWIAGPTWKRSGSFKLLGVIIIGPCAYYLKISTEILCYLDLGHGALYLTGDETPVLDLP